MSEDSRGTQPDEQLRGVRVTLRPAGASDREPIYQWLARSDLTGAMLGAPTFPEVPPPTWEQFNEDYGPHFFDGSRSEVEASYVIEADGEAVGQVNYEIGETPQAGRFAELDIWLRSEADTGRGYGSEAIDLLVRHVAERYGVRSFVIRPSARNHRAIRAYEKAGFVRTPMSEQEQAARFGPGDYRDTVVMLREVAG